MPQLVHEDVRGPERVGSDGAVEVENAAPAVGMAVGENLHRIVRSERGDIAKGAIVESQYIPLGSKGVVGRADRRAVMDAGRWSRDARFLGRGTQPPKIKVAA